MTVFEYIDVHKPKRWLGHTVHTMPYGPLEQPYGSETDNDLRVTIGDDN